MLSNYTNIDYTIDYTFVVVECDAIEMTTGLMRSSEDVYMTSVVTYWCTSGYVSVSQYSYYTIECLSTGEWNSDIPVCEGKKRNCLTVPCTSLL